jgi:hypothetical protein
MPINTETLNRQLYKRLSKYKPKPLDADGNVTPIEDEADVFKFTFSKDGEDYGTVFATIDDNHALTVYYNDDVTESPPGPTPGVDYDDSWYGLVKHLKSWAMHNQLSWQLKDRSHLEGDMARRNHMNKKDKISEGYHAMGKSRSYSDNIPSVKIVIEHSRQIEEGEQRYRNINKIFLENQMGERFLLDTKKPGIARVYARHIAEGGKVNDERWGHIQGLCEEYQKMAGFVRATRNGQFNESAQKLVNEAINHYQGLRESLSKMTGKRGYEAYFESWTPPLMEDEAEETNLNELFVQETLDPRIESVMPILSKLQKNLGEMKEVNALAEWADSLLEGGDGGEASEEPTYDDMGNNTFGGEDGNDSPADDLSEAPGAETLAHNQKTVKGNLDAFDLDEEESLTSNNPIGIPEEEGMEQLPQDALDLIDEYIAKIEPDADRDEMIQSVLDGSIHSSELEYALQDDLDEGILDTIKSGIKKVDRFVTGGDQEDLLKDLKKRAGVRNPENGKPSMAHSDVEKRTDEANIQPTSANSRSHIGSLSNPTTNSVVHPSSGKEIGIITKQPNGEYYAHPSSTALTHSQGATFASKDEAHQFIRNAHAKAIKNGTLSKNWLKSQPLSQFRKEQDVAEDLDANQKRVGQLGPTEKVKNNNIGKLVGANENFINTDAQAVVTEVDTGEYDARKSSSKGETTPQQEKEFRKKVQAYGKELEQRQKEKVKEGQDDLNAIKRLLGK